MFYADTVGLPNVLSRVQNYRARFGDYWKPAPLLERLVAAGRGFYQDDRGRGDVRVRGSDD
jgi:3-hydroxyacyl-CoA dehydrogenase